jgi:hypothetical protein
VRIKASPRCPELPVTSTVMIAQSWSRAFRAPKIGEVKAHFCRKEGTDPAA